LSVSQEFQLYVVEQLKGVGYVAARKMFGGVGLYADGIFFALIADDTLYFKVDSTNRVDYESAGMDAFRPYPDKTRTMQYYEVPIDVLEDQEQINGWARKSIAVALHARE